MNAKVSDLMVPSVVSTTRHKSLGHARDLMKKNGISSLPVIDPDGTPAGILTSSDILQGHKETTPASHIMAKEVYTVPQYADVSTAARVMRNHGIHHLLVTHEQKVVGILSTFDLLRLVEDHRFVMKNAPTPPKNHKGRT